MSTQNKPRICEILGVEVGEEFKIAGTNIGPVRINDGGYIMHPDKHITEGTMLLSAIIKHPEKIIRNPRFTPADLALMSHIRAIFGDGRIYRAQNGDLWFSGKDSGYELPRGILPGIKTPNDIVRIDQLLKEGDPNE